TTWAASTELMLPSDLVMNPSYTTTLDTLEGLNKNLYLHTASDEFPFDGLPKALHVARLSSLLWSVSNVFVLMELGKLIFDSTYKVLAFTSFAIFVPGFVFIGGVLNNDNAVSLAGSSILWLLWRIMDAPEDRRLWAILGVAFSAAILSKLNAVVFLLPIALVAIFAFKRRASLNLFWNAAIFVGVVLLLSGWWFVRNIMLYGTLSPFNLYTAVFGEGIAYSLQQSWNSLSWLWQSFWGRFGTGTVPMPPYVYLAFGIIVIICLTGWLWRLVRIPHSRLDTRWLILLTPSLALLLLIFYNAGNNTTGAQGRYLYPALGGIMAIMLSGLLALIPVHYHKQVCYTIAIVMPTLSAVAIFVWLPAAYTLPKRFTTFTPPSGFQKLDYYLADSIKLHGYTVSAARATPGETLTVTLYWEALKPIEANHAVFLQLVDEESTKVAQRQTISGLGMYQPTRWKVGEVIADVIPLSTDANASAPREYAIIGGMLDEKSGERLPMTRSDYKLGTVILVPRQPLNALPPFAYPVMAQFDQGIRLRGCSLKESALILYWQTSQSVNQNYKIFVHLWDANNQFVAGLDHAPMQGRFPTRYWIDGDWIQDELALPDRARIDRISVGLYAEDTQQRLPLLIPLQPEHSFSLPDQCWK
ncbi:MAG: glycosyltransferase family 39 protein, partial [Chloroflexi bacterium]|nr:glycosyltransferase family 39 protein [Chloroflexota bacterium]